MFTLSSSMQAPWSKGITQAWDWRNLWGYRTSSVAYRFQVWESYLNYIPVALSQKEGTKMTTNF